MVWCIVVHRGAKHISEKGRCVGVEFKTLFPILKKHLSDGQDVPDYFRELMAQITTVSEEEWGTGKDPSAKLSDETIRSYTKRKLPKKLAESIVYRLTAKNLVRAIKKRSMISRCLLADDLRGYDADIDADNVADKVAQWMVEIIRTSAGLVQQDALQRQKQQILDMDLKTRYGDYLLGESEGYCAFPGCGRPLKISEDGQLSYVYEVSFIDKDAPIAPDNLLAMCPQCHATYLMDNARKHVKELKEAKKALATHRQGILIIDNLPLEKGIVGVMVRVKNLNEKDLGKPSFDPKEMQDKLNPSRDMAVFCTVKALVTTYFLRIKEIMISLDKRGDIDYEEIQNQINAMYRRLNKAGKSRLEIFNLITEKIHHVTLQEPIYCQIVVSYFIESCDVFDAITK